MKALSLTQPWASLIAIGAKCVETRSWASSYRGPIAIHAAKGFPADCRDLCWDEPFRHVLSGAGLVDFGAYSDLESDSCERFDGLPRGAIVAVGSLAYVFLTGDTLNYRHVSRTMRGPNGLTYEMTPQEIAFGNYAPGRYGWVLKNVRPLREPVPCRGALGLWNVPLGIDEAVAEQSTLIGV